jgi:hypothetical protein
MTKMTDPSLNAFTDNQRVGGNNLSTRVSTLCAESTSTHTALLNRQLGRLPNEQLR